jgi:hypothetical protein
LDRVFIVQEREFKSRSSVGLEPARRFGRLVPLLPTILTWPYPHVMRVLREALKDFDDEDHIVLIGDPVAIGMSVGVALAHNAGRAKVLKWDRLSRNYEPVQIDLYQPEEAQ